jgi:hypothetical protein
VRYLKGKTTDKEAAFEVGVAFIGKRAPASYETEPWKRYDIANTAAQALATVDELRPPSSADLRGLTRHTIAVDMRVEVLDLNAAVSASEQTVSEDISERGATLFTTLEISVGRFIRLTSAQYGVTAYAVIRSRSTGADGISRIHVEFVDRQWPL